MGAGKKKVSIELMKTYKFIQQKHKKISVNGKPKREIFSIISGWNNIQGCG
jgi:hypothetical protein